MPKQLKLSVPNPCHENWADMTKAEQGRFCGSCQKQVVDFTSMSDTQLIAFFKNKPTGSVCGHFMPDQLDRSMLIPKKRIPWVKYFFQFTIPLFLTSLKAQSQTKATLPVAQKLNIQEKPTIQLSTTPTKHDGPIIIGQARTPLPEISGFVKDQSGAPVVAAMVTIKGTNTTVTTDTAGHFSISNYFVKKKITLVVASVGYEIKEKVITAKEIMSNQAISVTIRLALSVMGDVDVEI